jgi:hypothetical protein
MLAKAVRGLGEVFTVTLAVDDVVGCCAVALAGYLGHAIGLQVYIAREDQLDGGIDAALALRELFICLGRDVRYGSPKGSPCTKVRSGNLFPGELFYCYH